VSISERLRASPHVKGAEGVSIIATPEGTGCVFI